MAASIDSLALVSVELIACLWEKTLIYSIDVTLSLFSSGVAASLFQGQQVDDGRTERGGGGRRSTREMGRNQLPIGIGPWPVGRMADRDRTTVALPGI